MLRFPVEFFVPRNPNTLRGKPSAVCFRKFTVAKNFMDKRGGGVLRFCVENFLSHSAEKFRR